MTWLLLGGLGALAVASQWLRPARWMLATVGWLAGIIAAVVLLLVVARILLALGVSVAASVFTFGVLAHQVGFVAAAVAAPVVGLWLGIVGLSWALRWS